MKIEFEFRFRRPLLTRIADFLSYLFNRTITYGECEIIPILGLARVIIYLDAHRDEPLQELVNTIVHETLHAVICLTEPSVCDLDDEKIVEKLTS